VITAYVRIDLFTVFFSLNSVHTAVGYSLCCSDVIFDTRDCAIISQFNTAAVLFLISMTFSKEIVHMSVCELKFVYLFSRPSLLRLSLSVTLCIVAKRCVLEQKSYY